MPKASKKYCKTTPVKKMGFTQRSSCKAQGFIPRSDGTVRVSRKYRMDGQTIPSDVTSNIMDFLHETPAARAREVLKTRKSTLLGIPTAELVAGEREKFNRLTDELREELKTFQNPDKIFKLVKKGADPNTTDPNGYPLIYYAVNLQLVPLLEELIKNNVEQGFVDQQGNTLMHTAAQIGNVKIINLLSVDPNYVNDREDTPLHMAVMANRPSIRVVEALLEKGANPDDGSIDLISTTSPIYHLLLRLGAYSEFWSQDQEMQEDLENLWRDMRNGWQ